jgi:formamidopyrimidine-DNA glycosylase
MPELPEVETVVRALRSRLPGRAMVAIHERFPGVLVVAPEAAAAAKGRLDIRDVRRRGKFILVDLELDLVLVVHLRMTGHLSVVPAGTPFLPHTHVVMELDCNEELRFVDPRRFGRVRLETGVSLNRSSFFARLGPEPLELSARELADCVGSSRAALKAALLDQSKIAGVGNIYADEILFASGLHPSQPANTVLDREWEPLLASTQRILRSAIERGGSTIRDYRSVDGEAGAFQDAHRVYGRDGEPCSQCGELIRKIRVAGRGTHFCPRCQPLRRRRPRRGITRGTISE